MNRYLVSSRRGFGGDGLERDFGADAGDVAEGNANPVFHGDGDGVRLTVIRHAIAISEVADEGFFLQAVNPLFFQPGLLLRAEGFFDVVADVGRAAWTCAGLFVLDEHEIDRRRACQSRR